MIRPQMAGAVTLPSAERLRDLVDGMAGKPVLMLADLVADRFITGAPKRISREAPVLILRYERETFVPGGGANAICNVAALGGVPLALGVVGDDASGDRLLAELRERGITTEGIAVRPGYRTPTKTRILSGDRHTMKQQIVRFDVEDEAELGEAERLHFAGTLEAWRDRAEVAVLSDYGYGAVEPDLVPSVREALDGDGAVLCDSRYRLAGFRGVDGATPNEGEALALIGPGVAEDERIAAGSRELFERLATRFLLITRGSQGMTLLLPEGAAHIPIHGSDQVADVTGAGDTVMGTFALALAAGASPFEAALLADYAGGIVVHKTGTATTSPEELRRAVAADGRPREEMVWEPS